MIATLESITFCLNEDRLKRQFELRSWLSTPIMTRGRRYWIELPVIWEDALKPFAKAQAYDLPYKEPWIRDANYDLKNQRNRDENMPGNKINNKLN